jgi:uncharacterized membrane protein YgcG
MRRLHPLILLVIGPGCSSLPVGRPLPVEVVDAETHQPIRSANVLVSYAFSPSAWSNADSSGVTSKDGIARLRLASGDDPAVTVEVAAMGYLSEDKPLAADAVRKIEPAHWFESTDHRPAAVVVELYAEPRPTVELILPVGYHGKVKAHVAVRDDVPPRPGERQFAFQVQPDGTVEVVGPPILHRIFAPDFHLGYVDGAPLTQNARDSEIGYWWLKAEGDVQVFLVGTKADYNAAVKAGEATSVGTQQSGGSGGKGGGRRGGGRRGGGGGGMGGGM